MSEKIPLSGTHKPKPTIPKENLMLGSNTENVPEFIEMKEELNKFIVALNDLKNFAQSPEWINWESLKNKPAIDEPAKELRAKTKSAVVLKLGQIDKDLETYAGQIHKDIAFFLAEINRE